MAMSFILDGLYLGSMDDVYASKKLKESGVTHVLTIETKPIPLEFTRGLTIKFVHAFDMDNQDLLSHFDECFEFIDQGRASGGVLVHCFVGQSRSSTVVLAYLMRKLDMSLKDATAMVTKIRPMIRPNEGFQRQLELFESMGSVVDKTHNEYKVYRLNNLAERMQEAHLQSDLPDDLLSADPLHCKAAQGEGFYKCRKCRRPLFKKSAVLSHLTGRGGAAFDWRARLSSKELGLDDEEEKHECRQSLFIEPVRWMNSSILQPSGKLSCPKCKAKLGSFSWFGENCPCGTWIVPAFHIQPSKVDECTPRVLPVGRPACHNPTYLPVCQTVHAQSSHTPLPPTTTHPPLEQEQGLVKQMDKLKT